VDKLSREDDRPFVPLIADSPVLRLGPIIIPGTSGCWECWQLRSRQHATSPKEQSALWKFYDVNPQSGPGGYLEPFAMLGAAQIARAIHSCSSPQRAAGHIWQIDLFTRDVSTSRMVAVNDCPRCGMKRPVETRTYLEAQRQLAFLWTQDRVS
jgi:bacteriocin biosynthesis cyclodehydratase domain-containing protein